MYRKRRFYSSSRKRARWVWSRHVESVTLTNPSTSIDLLNYYKTVAGITIILPEITIWRIHLRISIKITLALAVDSVDGVLVCAYVDSQTQTQLNSFSDPLAQQHMLYAWLPVSHVPAEGGGNTAGTYFLEREFDIKAHRRIAKPEDTLFLQLVQTGGAVISTAEVQYSVLMRNPK